MHAARNLRLCTKDCVCLFVCPTKATDTENGQIDFSKCLDGCRLCVDACPSHALYLVEGNYAEPADKPPAVAEKLFALLDRKTEEEQAVAQMLQKSLEAGQKASAQTLVLKALQKSLRIVAEDAAREAAYMLPQSEQVRSLIKQLLEQKPAQAPSAPGFPENELRQLLSML